MPAMTILLSVVLMLIGFGTYAISNEPQTSLLLLGLFGLVVLGLGVASVVKQEMKKHLMHAAVLLASLGVLVPTIMFLVKLSEIKRDTALSLLAVLLTVVACGGYVYLAIQSFRAVRKDRTDDTDVKPEKTDPEKTEPATTENH